MFTESTPALARPSLTPPGKPVAPCIYSAALLTQAFRDSLRKFDPPVQIRNPVMFVVWVGALVTLALTIDPTLFGPSSASRLYNGVVTLILAMTVWFANFAEALAEGRGKAKADSLRQTRSETTGRRVLPDGNVKRSRRPRCAKAIWSG